jgi:hypothetical protein
MRRVFLFLVLILFGSLAVAQPARVLTGEHEAFTRVVVRLPAAKIWQVGRWEGGYALAMQGADGYDLRNFFDLIPRSRIRAASESDDGSQLFLDIGCICRAEVTELANGYLVIDIADGAPAEDSPFEQPLQQTAADRQFSHALPVLIRGDNPRAIDDRLFFAFRPATAPLTQSTSDDLAAWQSMLSQGLGRGVAAGLLDPQLQLPDASVAALPAMAPMPWPGLAISTGIDPATGFGAGQASGPNEDLGCVPDEKLDVASWSDGQGFVAGIAQARGAISQEFDRTDLLAAENLARFYLYYGFGREALQGLRAFGGISADDHYLRAIAQIMDQDPVDPPGLADQLPCLTRVALWAFLAAADDRQRAQADVAVVLAAFKELPPHLQRHLGPGLSDKFLALGEEDAAHQALNGARGLGATAIDVRLAEANLLSHSGEEQAALASLQGMLREEARITPAAMTMLLDQVNRQEQILSDDDMIIADALRFEQATTTDSIALAIAQTRAQIAAGRFEAAAEIMTSEASRLTEADLTALQREFASAAVENMSDDVFLAHSMSQMITSEDDINRSYADRLIALGFPEVALLYLTASNQETKHARALALLALQEPDAAIRTLQGDFSSQATDIRQAARDLRAGNPTASAFSDGSGATADWRNGQWTSLANDEDDLLRRAAEVVLDQDWQGFDVATPLTSSRALLGASANTRATLDDLLTRFAMPDFEGEGNAF